MPSANPREFSPGPEWYCYLLEDGTTTPWCMSRAWIEHPVYASFQLESKRVAVIRCRAKPERRPLDEAIEGMWDLARSPSQFAGRSGESPAEVRAYPRPVQDRRAGTY